MTVTQFARLLAAEGEDVEDVLTHCLACGGACTYGQVEPDPDTDPVLSVEAAWQAVDEARWADAWLPKSVEQALYDQYLDEVEACWAVAA